MKKYIIFLLIAAFIFSMIFIVTGCKAGKEQVYVGAEDTDMIPEEAKEEKEETGKDPRKVEFEKNLKIKEEGPYTIGVAMYSLADQYAKYMVNSLNKYAAEAYPDVKLVIVDGLGTLEGQLKSMEDLTAQKVDLIIFQPLWAKEEVEITKKTIASGIPVVCVNGTVAEDITPYSITDFKNDGRVLGKFLAEHAPENAKVLAIKGAGGNWAAELMWQGEKEEFIEKRPDVEILAEEWTTDWQKESGLKLMEDWVVKFPEFDVISGMSDMLALGALEAIRGTDHMDKIMVTHKDGDKGTLMIAAPNAQPLACQAIKDLEYTGTVFGDVPLMMQLSLDVSMQILNGEEYIWDNFMPSRIIDINNVDEIIELYKKEGLWNL